MFLLTQSLLRAMQLDTAPCMTWGNSKEVLICFIAVVCASLLVMSKGNGRFAGTKLQPKFLEFQQIGISELSAVSRSKARK